VPLTPLALALVVAEPIAGIEDRTLPWGCNDTAVIAWVESHSMNPIEAKDDLIGHGWVTATLKVKTVLKGKKLPHDLPVKYYAHTYLRHDRDFMLVLHQTDQGWVITKGQRMAVQPLLEDRCH
jgi:hypothetical protein